MPSKHGVESHDQWQTREKKGGGVRKVAGIGCGGIIALIVIVVIAASAAGGGSKQGTTGASDPASGKDVRVLLLPGRSGTVTTAGDVTIRVTIDTITDPARSFDQVDTPTPGSHYVTVSMTIENVGQKEAHGGEFVLRTNHGFEHRPTFKSGLVAADFNASQTLTAGGKVQTTIAFEVEDGNAIEWLKFDPNPFAAGDLYFDGIRAR